MRRKSLVWKLFPVYFAITLASVLIVGLAATSAMRKFYYSQIREDLAVRARLVHDSLLHSGVLPRFDNKRTIGIRKRTAVVIQELARSAKVRITLISKSGEVIADSHLDPAGMSNHSYRPEVHKALSGEIGTSRRLSKTLGITMFYVAIPIKHNGQIMGVLRVAQPANAIDSRPTAMAYRIVMISLATAVLTVAMSLIAARRLARAIAQIRNTAAAFANGDFSSRAPVTDIAELAGLADSLNSMAGRIEVQLRDMARQSAQQTAILASMREGVLAVADDDRILILNQAAADLLNVTLDRTLGRPLQEAVRNPALNRFIEQIRRGQQPADEDRVFRAQRDRLVQMNAAELRDPEGKHLGVLIVMSDITQSAKLDQMRREFVANVSHELKTPITAIKGYVETLLESKNLDQSKAREFLETTARQADRLNT
ncbi:MAG: cell wall metabolism sensor histidine kinase WalK, partial [Armatimonadetes bacterium]|nr:cell wall metabolism sensor histidine kinase WalK [Armatimonadota bacterium]